MLDTPNKLKGALVGDRIECQGQFGTIKYVGEVKGYIGIWFGIDWDDIERGKHNGTVNGTQYFIASSSKSGSFVRPEKVELGQNILSAIKSRYGQKDDEISNKYLKQQLLSIQQTINAPFLELVGFDKVANKQSNFQHLEIVDVNSQNVKNVGEPCELKQFCPNITDLNLAKNLINSWSVIFQTCNELKYLSSLNVSQNIFRIPNDLHLYNFPNLKTLICGSMQLQLDDFIKLSRVFPNLEQIIAPNNKISKLDLPNGILQNLKILHLDYNEIGSWQEICKLGKLPKLETLMIQRTGLQVIRFDDENETDLFKSLKMLSISDNLINDWESIGELNKLSNLEELNITKCPLLTQANYDTYIQYIIARIANLQLLNRTDVRLERKGAEYDYLRKYGLDWLKAKDNEITKKDFIKKHNRYLEIMQKYGELEEGELVVQTKTIQVSLVKINLVYEGKVISKKLPPTILIQKLIMLAQRLFCLSDRPNLVYISGQHPDIEIDLNDECKELGIYSIQDGDKIVVKT